MAFARPMPQQGDARAYRAATLTTYSLVVDRVITAMCAQTSAPLSLNEMAEIACLSPFHFNRIFRATTGIPPGEFLAALRLDMAKRLLLTTSLNVTDICFDLGYTSLGTFGLRFKRLTGLSPLQLRRVADAFTPDALLRAVEARATRSLALVDAGGVTGEVTAPDGFSGLIFLGLFPRPIPQERPVACVTVTAPGRFRIAPVPDGRYYLFGAALPWSPSALTYLVPDANLLVGVADQPVMLRGGLVSQPVRMALRPRERTDPPILGVFPPLLAIPAAARVIAAS